MKKNTKQIIRWARVLIVLCFVLTYSALTEDWWIFGLSAGGFLMAMLIGLVSTFFVNKTRRMIIKNMSQKEKNNLHNIYEQTGKKLGLMVAPFVFVIAVVFMIYGVNILVYTIPPAILLLIIICLPVWKKIRLQTTTQLLQTDFAKTNEIITLKKNSQQIDGSNS